MSSQVIRNSKQNIKGSKNNQQIINIIVDSLRKKKKKRSKQKPVEEPQQPPMTLDEIASTMKPAQYAPTNVVTVNPYNLPQPTMFDVFKQQELNAYMNRMEQARNDLADVRMNSEPMIQSLFASGRQEEAQQLSDSISQMEQSFTEQAPSSRSMRNSSVPSSVYSSEEEVIDIPYRGPPSSVSSSVPSSVNSNEQEEVIELPVPSTLALPNIAYTNPLFNIEYTPRVQRFLQDAGGMSPQEIRQLMRSPDMFTTPPDSVVRQISFAPSPYRSALPQLEQEIEQLTLFPPGREQEASSSTPQPRREQEAGPSTPEIQDASPYVPEIEAAKAEISDTIMRHPQKRVKLQGWQDVLYKMYDEFDNEYDEMDKGQKQQFRQKLKSNVLKYVDDMIMPGEKKDEMLVAIREAFKKYSRTRTQLQLLWDFVYLNPA